ncbi:MAG: glycosyltransferase [Balneolaceae bacterium]
MDEGQNSSKKIVHISTVHSRHDPRIFYKQCRSLAAHYDVHLFTLDGLDERVDGVMSHKLKFSSKNRFSRFFRAPKMAFHQAKELQPDLIHIHDPELLPTGILAARKGIPVIYDVHEDNTTAINQREYLPSFLSSLISVGIDKMERINHPNLHKIIAEKYYSERFPYALDILNYPLKNVDGHPSTTPEPSLLYTGNSRIERGALLHADLVNHNPDIDVTFVGRMADDARAEIIKIAGSNIDRLMIEGTHQFLPYSEIVDSYRRKKWLAGLAIFPYNAHYQKKQLTKIFEYMAAGIPVIYSDYPEWEKLFDPLNIGIAVNPNDPKEASQAIQKLKSDTEFWRTCSKNGQKHVRERFNWESQEEKLLGMYQSIVPVNNAEPD